MGFNLQVIDPGIDFKELIECEWISYEDPHQTFSRLFCPIIGEGPHAREESLQECTSRQLEWHTSDPNSYWQKGDDHEEEAYWYPAGGQRDFFTASLHRFDAPRAKLAPRPQVYLNIIYTCPEYRRRGIADMIMAWGIKRADEMSVEMWLDATIYGIPLYKKHGFTIVNENDLRPKKEEGEEDDEWKKIERELCPMTMWQMYRPVHGIYAEHTAGQSE